MSRIYAATEQFRERAHNELVRYFKEETTTRHEIIDCIVDTIRSHGLNPSLCPSLPSLLSEIDAQIVFMYNEKIQGLKKVAGIVDSEDVAHSIDWTSASSVKEANK